MEEPGRGRSARDDADWRVAEFVASLAGASAHTREAYAHDADEFVVWCERGSVAPRAVDHRTLRRYLAYL